MLFMPVLKCLTLGMSEGARKQDRANETSKKWERERYMKNL